MKFRVLNTFRRGVVLVSVPEGIVLHLQPGDEATITDYPLGAVLQTGFGADERHREARRLPHDSADPVPGDDWRHTMSPRRSVIRDV